MARTPAANRTSLQDTVGMLVQPSVVPRMEIQNLSAAQRMHRKPYEDFFTIQRPWDIQPFCMFPVLPGDTLMNLQMQSRVVTDPLVHRLSGWWMEYYFFYVKHTDLMASDAIPDANTTRDAIIAMHLENAALGLQNATRNDAYYKCDTNSRMNWVSLATHAVTRWYFRDGGEGSAGYGNYGYRAPANAGTIFKARVRDPMWLESVKIEDVNPSGQGDLPGVEDFQDVFVPTAWATHYAQWEHMRQVKLLPEDVSFEDYLATFGVSAPQAVKETERRPELIRYLRNWQYPSNTVDPTDGSAASAVSWAVSARADKARRFPEPGFILGVSVARPKVFFGNQVAHASSMLDDAYGWLPAVLRDEPFTSLIEYDHNEGPLAGVFNAADDYWVDRRDLFVRGGQFLNFAPADATTKAPIVDLPKVSGADNDINLWYASDTDAQNLFVDSDDSEGLTYVRQDGIVRCDIKSAEHASRDHT
ncbi:MAG: major capsid protein [Arizlama microvirus]|nr:MAG: major capsid protein [Arizlama microvirus]